jgi:hypothetical protein
MKVFLQVFIFAFVFLTNAFALDVECKNRQGKVVDASGDVLKQVMNSKANRPQVLVEGTVTKILPEDKAGLPHQKYLINAYGVKLQIVSNLEFGKAPVQVGSKVQVCGEYINAEGGMIHWTHFDPHGNHPDGYTVLDGQLYGDTETK